MDVFNILKQHPHIIKLFNTHYPDLQFELLDNELMKDIIESIMGETINNTIQKSINNASDSTSISANVIEQNYDLADKYIPEMLLPTNLIYLNGKINNIPIKILFDTGATSNCIFKSKIIEAGLDYLVDNKNKTFIQGINSNKETYGKIWYTEIELELELKSSNKEKNYAMIGLNLQIVNDENSDKNLNKFDVILGLNFMKSYRTNIDFSTNTITLNNTIKIKFD
jgi:hypothetical protein